MEGATLGTVYFPFSCAFLFGCFNEDWERGFPRGREYLAIGKFMFIICMNLLLYFFFLSITFSYSWNNGDDIW